MRIFLRKYVIVFEEKYPKAYRRNPFAVFSGTSLQQLPISAYFKEKGLLMNYANLVPETGVIVNMTRGNDCCSQMISLQTENGIVNFNVTPATEVVDSRQLRPGMRVTAYYDSSLPVPLIFPPQYTAQLLVVLERNEQVMLNFFNRNLLARDRSLQLNIGRNTTVETLNGQRFTCGPGNRFLLVFYSATTRSIPPQTTPRRVIVLC